MKYTATITKIGEEALELFEKSNLLIIFGENAPQELQNISVIHNGVGLANQPQVGDTVVICKKKFAISAIGTKALQTLKQLGHWTFCFDGAAVAALPGYIALKAEKRLSSCDIVIGEKIEFF